jgi:type II secretory pathway component PulF
MRALLLQSVIPPLLFILVGSMVLFIVIAQFGPMINLISALS